MMPASSPFNETFARATLSTLNFQGQIMFTGMFESTTIPVLQEVVGFTQARHNVLAGNIANLEVPGYKARDLSVTDFQSRLRQAIEQRNHPSVQKSPGEPDFQPTQPLAEIAKNSKTVMRHDENNVGVEQQAAEVMKNQLDHNMALSLMVQQFRQLDVAISGRV
jgi:flagellar basal-body rod protein FlgB